MVATSEIRGLEADVIKREIFREKKGLQRAQSGPASSIDMWAGKSYAIIATCLIVRVASPAVVSGAGFARRFCCRFVAAPILFSCQEWNCLQQQEECQHCE